MKLYAVPRPERYEYGHGIDGQYLDVPLPKAFGPGMIRRGYLDMRRKGVPERVARSILWNCLWMGGLYGERGDLHTPFAEKERIRAYRNAS